MLHPKFGTELLEGAHGVVETFLAMLQPLLAHQGRLSSVEASVLLQKAYLVRYGLATEEELTRNPAALVKMRHAEDTYSGTLLEDHFEHFIELEIYLYMTWKEYMSHPRHELEMIRRVAEKTRKLKNNRDHQDVSEAERLAKLLSKQK